MSIRVVCPGCHKSFNVGDQFAGKSGPCPKCKATIQVPTKEEEVKVHAPTQFTSGGKSTTGELLTKPVSRKETLLRPVTMVAIAGGALTVLLVTWVAGEILQDSLLMRIVGLLLISPPLTLAAYSFLRDDELQPHQGRSLYVRMAICSAAYTFLWGAYGWSTDPEMALLTGELWEWLFFVPPLMIAGALVGSGCFELDLSNGFFHYAFYLSITVLLRWVAGMGWVWDVARAASV